MKSEKCRFYQQPTTNNQQPTTNNQQPTTLALSVVEGNNEQRKYRSKNLDFGIDLNLNPETGILEKFNLNEQRRINNQKRKKYA